MVLRIAVVSETWPPEVNGVARTAARFVEALRELGHEIQLVRPRQGSADRAGTQEILLRGLPIPRYPNLRLGLPAKSALVRLWSFRRPDVVHIITEGPLGWSALQAAEKLRLPVVSDFRTNFHAYSSHYGVGWLKKPILAYLRKFHNRTAATLVPTEAMRVALGQLGFERLRVIARGVDTRLFDPARRDERLRAAWGAAAGRPGADPRRAPRPGEEPGDAGRRLRSRLRRAARAHRDGRRRPCAARARGAVSAGGVRRNAQRDRPRGALRERRRFLFPSLTETFGNVTLEAMASGLAVVAYDYAAPQS